MLHLCIITNLSGFDLSCAKRRACLTCTSCSLPEYSFRPVLWSPCVSGEALFIVTPAKWSLTQRGSTKWGWRGPAFCGMLPFFSFDGSKRGCIKGCCCLFIHLKHPLFIQKEGSCVAMAVTVKTQTTRFLFTVCLGDVLFSLCSAG